MQFIDTHCHLNMLDLSPYQGDMAALISQAKAVGVSHILCVGVDLEHAPEVISIAERFPQVYASVGVHPSEKTSPSYQELMALAKHPKVIALGETGLDYHYPDTDKEQQKQGFRLHIQIAKELKKPLIIHSRDAREDTIQILKEENAQEIGGILHCFTESWEMAQQALDLNFYISFSGIITFKNAVEVALVAQKTPLEKILIETDAPYLTPVPHRGKKPNEPQYVPLVAAKIAELKNLPIQTVSKQTTENFFSLFKSCQHERIIPSPLRGEG
jgi:TatD DNase family protein